MCHILAPQEMRQGFFNHFSSVEDLNASTLVEVTVLLLREFHRLTTPLEKNLFLSLVFAHFF